MTVEERAAKKEERLAALAQQQRWRNANRVRQRRLDTMQDLIVKVDADLMEPGGALEHCFAALREKITGDGATVEAVYSDLGSHLVQRAQFYTIAFARRIRSVYDPLQKLWAPLDEEQIQQEPTVLCVLKPDELFASISDGTLVPRIEACGKLQRIVVLVGIDAYLRKERLEQTREYTRIVRQRVHHQK
ncbi:hypothetical protein MVES1_003333 [Malassezia vespertilionis]|uniref:uncharacterized protein n=1 Tax=Malassezia vespertilionis TaxID=2020962 RepID=UPI0024B19EB0|nr:uncharacterized protein MVES1_003333 [Malassezia vespertilionis]WFD07964.1 hypothetical protein MVES1_003333 [Malassezia vespertilionis]